MPNSGSVRSEALFHVPPQDVEAEAALISSVLLDNSVFDEIQGLVTPADFYRSAHQHIWEAVARLRHRGEPVDLLTLKDELRHAGRLESIGGSVYLARICDAAPLATNAPHYARIITEKATRRRMIEAANRTAAAAFEDEDLPAAIDRAQAEFQALGARSGGQTAARASTLALDAAERYEALEKRKGQLLGLPTGITDLDTLLCGLQAANLYVFAARPSIGKTAFAAAITPSVAEHRAVAWFSLEMSRDQIWDRFMAAEAGVNLKRFQDGLFTDADKERITRASGRLYDLPIFVDDTAGIHWREIRRRSRILKREQGVGLVVIDHLQLVRADRQPTRDREVGEITAGLKALAKELSLPVLLLSQLNRALESRTNPHKRPRLSDLRDSGNIEQDADVVAFLYRPELYGDRHPWPPDGGEAPFHGQFEINVAKHRNGELGTVIVVYRPETGRFDEKN